MNFLLVYIRYDLNIHYLHNFTFKRKGSEQCQTISSSGCWLINKVYIKSFNISEKKTGEKFFQTKK